MGENKENHEDHDYVVLATNPMFPPTPPPEVLDEIPSLLDEIRHFFSMITKRSKKSSS